MHEFLHYYGVVEVHNSVRYFSLILPKPSTAPFGPLVFKPYYRVLSVRVSASCLCRSPISTRRRRSSRKRQVFAHPPSPQQQQEKKK
ncbi:hypothetical protein VNO80_14456 [Phaseolus coccineus]|uniref:Uncharacterized protein n=1 Tax=Phaseolus coccineus TaxID=3886 RepID=A0AAN9MNF3_PHACN